MGGNGAGGSGAGMGGNGAGGVDAGMGGNGAGGSGVGGADAGAGGMASGAGGAAMDAGPDLAAGGTDGSIDVPVDGTVPIDAPPETSLDTAPACGTGCPANVLPASLVLWVSADVGVSCNQSSPPRVTGWKNRRAGSTVTLMPGSQNFGPRCDGQTLSGTPLPFFNRTTTDIDNGVLRLDLTPLNGSDYTVFVVERRRSIDAAAVMGTDVSAPVTDASVDASSWAPTLTSRTDLGTRAPSSSRPARIHST